MAAEKDDSRIVPVHFCRVTVIFFPYFDFTLIGVYMNTGIK